MGIIGLSMSLALAGCGGGAVAVGLGVTPPASTTSNSGSTGPNVSMQSSASWSFDDVRGSTVINSGFEGWNIELNSASIVPGRVGNSVSFDETLPQSYGVFSPPVWVGNSMEFADGRISIALWIRPRKVEAIADYLLLGGAPSNGFQSIFLWVRNGKIAFELQPVAGGLARDSIIESNSSVTPAAWTHVAVTYDGKTATVYLNGVVDNVNTISHGVPKPYNYFYIGGTTASAGGPLTFPGQIDELQIKASTLTAGQVAALVNVSP